MALLWFTALATTDAISDPLSGSAPPAFDVLVYGSTPGGVMAAVAAARHGAKTALLSQRDHIGGVCSGGLGETDVGACADTVIGGLGLEFFKANAQRYGTLQPRAPWNLEPHVAKEVFLAMLAAAGVTLLPPAEVVGATKTALKIVAVEVEGGATYTADVFIDASYEGDLMAATPGVSYTWGRESKASYSEPAAGSQNAAATGYPYGIEYINPFDAAGDLLPLLRGGGPVTPYGSADRAIQAYNFRLCVTNNATIRAPFTKPPQYDPARWELLRRFWLAWPNSTNAHKAAQATMPTAILGRIPSTTGAAKYDANNCGYNPIHTDMMGANWDYPEANRTARASIWQDHVDYTQGFLWFMSTDASVPASLRASQQEWGYCADEFPETDHFPPQLYIREARRLVGDKVFTQNDVTVQRTAPLGNGSIGMGCYNFDSHCVERFACTNMTECTLYKQPYVAVQCSGAAANPGIYQMPVDLLLPKRAEASNLLVPVCASASHVAYATVRMEPQFMMLGHAAGIVAAMSVNATAAVQDVDVAALHALLLRDGAKLEHAGNPGGRARFACALDRCLQIAAGGRHYANSSCSGKCPPQRPAEWLLLKEHWKAAPDGLSAVVTASPGTWLKKSEALAATLPPSEKQFVAAGTHVEFEPALKPLDADYWFGSVQSLPYRQQV